MGKGSTTEGEGREKRPMEEQKKKWPLMMRGKRKKEGIRAEPQLAMLRGKESVKKAVGARNMGMARGGDV